MLTLQVCLRGYTIFKGYFKDEKNTREAMDEDGSDQPSPPPLPLTCPPYILVLLETAKAN